MLLQTAPMGGLFISAALFSLPADLLLPEGFLVRMHKKEPQTPKI